VAEESEESSCEEGETQAVRRKRERRKKMYVLFFIE
jgi:hypothetical protein